ncbi:MAG: TrmH family RNA methyltransferase [Rhodothermales bacterium]
MPDRLTARRRKEIASLARKKHRERLGQMLIEGVRSVEAAVAAGAPLVDLVVTEAAWEDARVQALVNAVEVPVYVVPGQDVARLSDVQANQGLLAVARPRRLAEAQLATLHTILALDGVQDPGNVGTLIRTAAWFGTDAVLAGPGTADVFNPKVVRAAMGGLWDVHMAQTGDLGACLAGLQQHGFACYGADLQGTPVAAWAPRRPSVLVLGSEAHGLSPDVRAHLDERVAVTGASRRVGTESLNVAVAAGILVYQWLGEASS